MPASKFLDKDSGGGRHEVASLEGFEPPTRRLEGGRSFL